MDCLRRPAKMVAGDPIAEPSLIGHIHAWKHRRPCDIPVGRHRLQRDHRPRQRSDRRSFRHHWPVPFGGLRRRPVRTFLPARSGEKGPLLRSLASATPSADRIAAVHVCSTGTISVFPADNACWTDFRFRHRVPIRDAGPKAPPAITGFVAPKLVGEFLPRKP